MYVMTLSDVKEYAALRVEPLDEACWEWNEKALLPVGYECNNLFLTDWDETDFGELDFYDLFDVFYPQIYHRKIPWQSGENAGNSTVYGLSLIHISVSRFLGVLGADHEKLTCYIRNTGSNYGKNPYRRGKRSGAAGCKAGEKRSVASGAGRDVYKRQRYGRTIARQSGNAWKKPFMRSNRMKRL